MRHQQNYTDLINTAKSDSVYVLQEFLCADGVSKLICLNGKIVIPKTLQKYLVQWYHTVIWVRHVWNKQSDNILHGKID